MTDITDQDRRDARAWAEKIDPTYQGNSRPLLTAARVILAAVDAPAPTLAEELRYRADLLDNGDPDGDTPHALRTLATDAAQMEHDLAEASAEVERLTAERLDRNHETKARVADALNNLEQAETVTVQKGAESNAETPTPADVKPGEAWIVEVNGERRTALKDDDGLAPWNHVDSNGLLSLSGNKSVTLVTRLVPAPRVITNADDLDELAEGSIIRDRAGDIMVRDTDGWTEVNSDEWVVSLPATVLWEPEV